MSAKFAGLPTWTNFLRELVKEVTDSHERDLISRLIESGKLSLAAECLEEFFGEVIYEKLANTFAKEEQHIPVVLGRFATREVITTNYDLLLERAMPWCEPLLPSAGIDRLITPGFKLVKLHGTIATPNSCVLSLSSYVKAYNENLQWYLTDVFSNNVVIFIGTSMSSAEPFFRTLRLLRAAGRDFPKHIAILAVPSSEAGRTEGKRLQNFGIDLLPYIPDENHTFLDSLTNFLDKQRGSSEAIHHRLNHVGQSIQQKHYLDAAVHLWNICTSNIKKTSDRRSVGDMISRFFATSMSAPRATGFVAACRKLKIDLSQLWLRGSDMSIRTRKSWKGLRESLAALEAASGETYAILRARLDELRPPNMEES